MLILPVKVGLVLDTPVHRSSSLRGGLEGAGPNKRRCGCSQAENFDEHGWIVARESQWTLEMGMRAAVCCGFSPFVPSILSSQARGTSRGSSSAEGECSDGDGQTCE
jgi:hypothetical protein